MDNDVLSASACTSVVSSRATSPSRIPLRPFLNDDPTVVEIGVDEVGRGPLFGRVYTAAVILPKQGFDVSKVKDSKLFHSQRKIEEAAEYIRAHALAYAVDYKEEHVIDRVNILKATMMSMKDSILETIRQFREKGSEGGDTVPPHPQCQFSLLIDGNQFHTLTYFDPKLHKFHELSHTTVEKGDSTFASIAAASILAKVARDQYVRDLCHEHPFLHHCYGLASNKGYGAKVHMDGIRQFGITQWHRKSFAPCKHAAQITEDDIAHIERMLAEKEASTATATATATVTATATANTQKQKRKRKHDNKTTDDGTEGAQKAACLTVVSADDA